MQTDFEALNLQSFGFGRCYYYELHCLCCRMRVRIALDKETIIQHPCPSCGELQTLEFLAKGFTKKQLPFSEPTPVDLESPQARRRERARFRATLPAEIRMYAGTR